MNLDAFTLSYIQAALWSTSDDNDEPLDSNYGVKDIPPATFEEMIADCKTFQEDNAALLTDKNCHYKQCPMLEHAGHDFWLTRCHHGSGFWDGDWEEEAGKMLTDAANKFKEVNLYVGDDGLIYS